MTTPASDGFRMPAEWEPHRRCWMAWPCREDLWGAGLEAAQKAYAEVARTIVEYEPVTMICNPGDAADVSLSLGQGIDVLSLPIDDSWTRDTGPTFVINDAGVLASVAWRFNAWGELYTPFDEDAQLATRIAEHLNIKSYAAPLVMEGGAVHVDGEGTALATEQCLMDPRRNPGLDRTEIEALLRAYLGVERVIWLPRGLHDDETNGHIDEIACFVRPGVVMCLATDDEADDNFEILRAAREQLRTEVDAGGRTLEVIDIPQPARKERGDGRRLTLSYVNFYLAGTEPGSGAVIAPAFETPEDQRAFRILRDAFPDRKVVQVPALDITRGGGGIHCITQQQPAV